MKTAVSIPDDVFAEAETLAHRSKYSRSELYARALREYVGRHSQDRLTEAMDRAMDDIDEPADRFISRAGHRTLERAEW
jgi:metal-responsive CopG/Arc/MetJ family transcriptional regulator